MCTSHTGTPLWASLTHKTTSVARMILDSGADVNTRDQYGGTTLDEALRKGCNDFIALLLEYGADPKLLEEKNVPRFEDWHQGNSI